MAGAVQSIALGMIRVGARLRAVDDGYVALLASSIAKVGLQNPVQVAPADADGAFTLVAGAHRLAAARSLGWLEIPAVVVSAGDILLRIIEIDENLARRELSALDRAVALAELKGLYEAANPQTVHGRNDKRNARAKLAENNASGLSGQFGHLIDSHTFAHLVVPGFHRHVADKAGISPRAARREVKRARIEPELRALLAASKWADHGQTLDGIAKLDPQAQQAVVMALTRAEDPARDFQAARREFQRVTRDAGDEVQVWRDQRARLFSAWRKATKKAQDEFIALIAASEDVRDRLELALIAAADAGHGGVQAAISDSLAERRTAEGADE